MRSRARAVAVEITLPKVASCRGSAALWGRSVVKLRFRQCRGYRDEVSEQDLPALIAAPEREHGFVWRPEHFPSEDGQALV